MNNKNLHYRTNLQINSLRSRTTVWRKRQNILLSPTTMTHADIQYNWKWAVPFTDESACGGGKEERSIDTPETDDGILEFVPRQGAGFATLINIGLSRSGGNE